MAKANGFRDWFGNGSGLGWLWKTAPLIFAAGVLFTQIRGVQTSVDKIESRVQSIEESLRNRNR